MCYRHDVALAVRFIRYGQSPQYPSRLWLGRTNNYNVAKASNIAQRIAKATTQMWHRATRRQCDRSMTQPIESYRTTGPSFGAEVRLGRSLGPPPEFKASRRE